MKILNMKVSGLPLFQGKLDIDFFAKQNVRGQAKENLHLLFENRYVSIYTNNVIGFTGINAAGKTSTLKVIAFVMAVLNGEAISTIPDRNILDGAEKVSIESVLSDEDMLYKTCTIVEIQRNINLDYNITEEYIWKKNISEIKTKRSLLEFADPYEKERENDSEYLKKDVSIVFSLTKNNSIQLSSKIQLTNINFMSCVRNFPEELIEFLDPNIEYLRFNPKTQEVRLKFYNEKEITIPSPLLLENYLSSGTIKGLNLFFDAMNRFKDGGYLIIDELENHFNKELVSCLLRFFMSNHVNKQGATLIFSTHYLELLDELERNDSIYVVRNSEGIRAENLNTLIKRNDMKKSEILESDYLGGTAPDYDAYMKLKKKMITCGGGFC